MFPANRLQRRRAATAVFVLVTLPVLLGMAALTVDVAVLCNVRTDLQNSADAAAMAAAYALSSESMQKVRTGKEADSNLSAVRSIAAQEIDRLAELNHSFGAKSTLIAATDIVLGQIDVKSATSALDSSGSAAGYNAVQVVTRRGGGANSPVSLFFAPIFGKHYSNVSASAVAAFDDRVSGYDPDAGEAPLWPMTMSLNEYNWQVGQNVDSYSFDGDSVNSDADGLPEVKAYPAMLAPGNFGLLNIGMSNQSVNGVADHIENGVSGDDLEAEIGESVLSFIDTDGTAKTHLVTGTPGLKASLESSVKQRIGDIVAIPIHDQVTGSGANTTYRIIGVRFARVMSVSLKSGTKYLWMQPVTYTGQGLLTNPNAPSSNGAAGRVVLVR